jgi:peptide deformylase
VNADEASTANPGELRGSVRPVIRAPAAVLSSPAPRIDPATVVDLAADLIATMRVSPGCVGLAAVQLGVSAQVFVVDVTGHPKAHTCHGLIALCNAEVVAASQWKVGREGCMSVPDLTGDVRRAGRLTVAGQAVGTGERLEVTTDAFEARALQHEIDHCGGLLFLHRVAGAHALHQRQVYLD